MTLLILAVLLASGASLWVIQPILARRAALLVDTAPGTLLDAEARKRVALAALKEVEYDFLAGKLDEADYRAQLDRLGAEALQAIQAADAAQAAAEAPAAPPPPAPPPILGDGSTAQLAAAEEPRPGRMEFPLSPRRGVAPSWARGLGGEGHECGFVNPAGSRFCAGCGARLS